MRILCCMLIGLTVCLTGCYDSTEVSEELYAIMMGLDCCENGVQLSAVLPIYGSGEGQEENRVVTAEAETVSEALNRLHLQTARRISLLHLKAVVFSEQLAKEGLAEHVDAIRRQTGSLMGVMVTRTEARTYLDLMKNSAAGVLSQELEQLLFRPGQERYFPIRTFRDFCRGMASDSGQSYAVYCNPDDETGEKYGMAVFRGDKLSGVLDRNQTVCTMMVRREWKRGKLRLDDCLIEIREKPHVDVKTSVDQDVPKIDVTLRLQGGLTTNGERYDPDTTDEMIARKIQEYLQETIKKTQLFGSDIWEFGTFASRKFATIQDWKKYDWNNRFGRASVKVNVRFKTVKTEVERR